MGDIFFEIQDELMPVLRAGDTARCERTVAERLAALPQSPFHIAIELSITNSPADIAAHFDGFFRQEAVRFKIGAAYTEMNGFDINPDRWFFDVFAFTEYGGHDDYDWISDWQSESYEDMTITGLERLQEVYASPAFRDKRFKDAGYVAGLLVVTKFQDLIRRAAPHMRELHFPLLATAHDYDFIYEARRDG
jgi:hypothetical protein